MYVNTKAPFLNFFREVFSTEGLPVHSVWLHFRFSPHETAFSGFRYEKSLPLVRFTILVSILFFLSFHLLDYYATGEYINESFWIRFAVYLPFSVLVLALTYTLIFSDLWQYLMVMWILMTGISGIITTSLVDSPYFYLNMMGLMIYLMAVFLIFGLKPHVALGAFITLVTTALFIFSMNRSLHPDFLWPLGVLFGMIAVLGYFVVWHKELELRKVFWLNYQKNRYQTELQQINAEFSVRVRTYNQREQTCKCDQDLEHLKTTILSNISHELRTPLNAIIGYSSLLEGELSASGKAKEYLSGIRRNGLDLMNFMDTLIDASLLETGNLKTDIQYVRIEALIEEVIHGIISRKIEKPDVKFNISRPQYDAIDSLYTDPFRVRQILLYLLDNAFKYTEAGSIELGYRKVLRVEREYLKIFVRDSGLGISIDEQPHLFDKFSRRITTGNANHRGAGLSLYVSQKLTEAIGGELHVQSEPGKGSVFSLYLPVNFG